MTTWLEEARCRELVARGDALADDWFPSPHESKQSTRARWARAACLECPVRRDCLTHALLHLPAAEADHGIWGGLDAQQRRQLLAHGERS